MHERVETYDATQLTKFIKLFKEKEPLLFKKSECLECV